MVFDSKVVKFVGRPAARFIPQILTRCLIVVLAGFSLLIFLKFGRSRYVEETAISPEVGESWQYILYSYIHRPDLCCHNLTSLGGVTMSARDRRKLTAIDGDKMMCLDTTWRPPQSACLVYSFGINGEWSFDRDVIARFGCSVIGFDPSMVSTTNNSITEFGARFLQIGLVGERQLYSPKKARRVDESNDETKKANNDPSPNSRNRNTWPVATVDEISRRLGHHHQPIHYLKVDVEGDEWAWLEMEPDSSLTRVWQLGIEVHLTSVQDPVWAQRYVRALDRLQRLGFRLAHSHANRVLTPSERVQGIGEVVSRWYELLLLNERISQ